MGLTQARPFGYIPVGFPNAATMALSTANARSALSFVPPVAATLTEAARYLSALTGSLTAAQLPAELQADAAGSPSNTPLETVNCNQTPSAGAVHTWTFTTALTAGARYWIVLKNTHGTPASNNVTVRYGGSASAPVGVGDATVGWSGRQSTDATTWATGTTNGSVGLRVGYGDGSVDGYPFHNMANTPVGDGVYGTRELGDRFTTPSGAGLTVSGLRMHLATKTGTPTGTIAFRLYEGTTLVATTAPLYTTSPVASIYDGFFPAPVTFAASTVHRATICESTQSDASTNRYNARVYAVFDEASSRTLLPFVGTMQKTYYDGSTWADTVTEIIPMELIFDASAPLVSSGSGGITRARLQSGLSALG